MEYQSQTKKCQSCKKDFIIEPEDFKFYEKIGVPAPTFCPECRTIRRLCWRNEMSLFRRKCDVPTHEENLISIYNEEEKLTVYDIKSWWGDGWNALTYGKDYDFSKTFFEQWRDLRNEVPVQALSSSNAVNSDYCNVALDSKDSYMCSGSWHIERAFYSNRISEIKESLDLYVVHKAELCYECLFCINCYHLLYSFNCTSCVDSYFLYDCSGCSSCFGCTNLRNKSYCMWNEQLTREEYLKKLEELNLKSYKTISKLKIKFENLRMNSIHRFANQIRVIDSTGDNLEGVKNTKFAFDSTGKIEDSKYIHWTAHTARDCYDCGPGVGDGELCYEVFDTGVGGSRNLFGSINYNTNDAEYSFNCYNCSNLFGCIGLRSKKYCILNKQYTKESFDGLRTKIKEQMMQMPYIDKRGLIYKYGEFFPAELSTFCYNETQAQDYFPIIKEKALEMGYKWREKNKNDYEITIESKDLPDRLDDINDSITKEIIGCENRKKNSNYCRGAYKITIDELNLYKKIGIPLPHFCFYCRHENRLKKRNPMHLWRRSCMCKKTNHNHKEKCTNEFETSYAPDRPEIIYCESCYNKEVY